MNVAAVEARTGLASTLRQARARIADLVTDAHLREHPALRVMPEDRAHQAGREDAINYIDHLAGAVESGTPAAFGEYARWVVGFRTARGLSCSTAADTLRQIDGVLPDVLTDAEHLTLRPYFMAARHGLEAPQARSGPLPSSPLAPAQRRFLQGILETDRRGAASVARDAVAQGHALIDIYVDVVQESLYELGRLWQSNRITVAQEHGATAVCQYVLAELYTGMPAARVRRGRAVITGVEGEHHQVGANLVADALEADGWNVRFLGANTPHDSVLQTVAAFEADALGVSVTMLFNVAMARQLVRDARAQQSPLTVIVGGAAFRASPELWREIGADAHARDVRAAVEAMRRPTPTA